MKQTRSNVASQCVRVLRSYLGKHTGSRAVADSDPDLVVFPQKKMLFAGIPLVGSSAIIHTLTRSRDIANDTVACYYQRVKDSSRTNLIDYVGFTVVRNPWERAVSCYNKRVINARGWSLKKRLYLSPYKNLRNDMQFEEFVEWLNTSEGSDSFADRHWMSQHRFVTQSYLPENLTILRLENLDHDMPSLLSRFGFKIKEIPKMAGTRDQKFQLLKSNCYRDYYNTKTKKLIGDRYEKDANIYDYDF